jgi:YVTN family beta-propeller protein
MPAKKIQFCCSIGLLLILFSSAASAAASPYIAVGEKVAGAVGFYSEDGAPLAQVKVGPFPHEAVLSKDGRLLYVSVNGVLWMTEDKMGANAIAVVDVRTMKKVADIDLGRFHRPHGIARVPNSDRLLATTERPYGLILVDPAAGKIVRDYDVKGKSPHMVMPAPSGDWVFVSNVDSDSLAAIQLRTGEVKVIPTGSHPQGGVFSPAGDRLYLTNTNANRISILDVKTQKAIGAISTGKGPARVAITPDGKTLVYNLQFEPAVGFADVASAKQVATVPLPGRPLSLSMTRDGRRAFSGVQDQDKVFFISVSKRAIERVIELPKGSGPDAVIPLEQR